MSALSAAGEVQSARQRKKEKLERQVIKMIRYSIDTRSAHRSLTIHAAQERKKSREKC